MSPGGPHYDRREGQSRCGSHVARADDQYFFPCCRQLIGESQCCSTNASYHNFVSNGNKTSVPNGDKTFSSFSTIFNPPVTRRSQFISGFLRTAGFHWTTRSNFNEYDKAVEVDQRSSGIQNQLLLPCASENSLITHMQATLISG